MSGFLETTIQRARSDKQAIVLPEGSDDRTFAAARRVIDEGIADLYIIGNPETIAAKGYDLDGIRIIDPAVAPQLDTYAAKLAELRANKGVTLDDARALLANELYFGCMMVHTGDADGMVSGACHSSADVLRPALQILKAAPGTALVSSFFVMDVPVADDDESGLFVFSDCGLNIEPDAEGLSEIAISSAKSFEALCEQTPRVAMLSYSTKNSAGGAGAEKVREATRMAHEKAPDLLLDGELQLDAAIVPSVAASKASGSNVAGKANVLIFPDLGAGNIGYKLTQRLAHAQAYGPILQGVGKPVNDLSRGCSADDIVGVIAITCVQSQIRKAAL